ncbi:hypothetical protein Peur_053764 [Populus x canadensis]
MMFIFIHVPLYTWIFFSFFFSFLNIYGIQLWSIKRKLNFSGAKFLKHRRIGQREISKSLLLLMVSVSSGLGVLVARNGDSGRKTLSIDSIRRITCLCITKTFQLYSIHTGHKQ